MTILVSVLVLAILIFVHELGHFLVARYFNVGVLEFAIGFGKKIWQRKTKETTYSLRLIPLGGYVKMLGDDLRAVREGQAVSGSILESVERPDNPGFVNDRTRWFYSQAIYKRMAIVLAGPFFNYAFAVLLTIFSIYVYGKSVPIDQPLIGKVIEGYPAQKSGLKEKDFVRTLNGEELKTWEDLASRVASSGGKEIVLAVSREENGAKKEIEIRVAPKPDAPELKVLEDTPRPDSFKIGIMPDLKRESVGLFEAVGLGFSQTYYMVRVTLRGLYGMVARRISASNIAGPIYIFKEAANSAKRGFEHVIDFMVFLSISLAVLNLLPVPVLDGGHMLFFTIEAILRRPLSLKVQEVCTQVGMFLLLSLMVFALGNDLVRLLG